jgi:hypothetical protein
MTSSYFNFDGINESTLPSWGDSFNYKPSDSITGSSKWGKALLAASKYLSQPKEKEEDKYRNQVAFGNSLQSSISEGPDKYTRIYTPAQQAPVFLPGVQGSPGLFGALGSAAGALAGGLIGGPAGVGPGAQIGGSIGGAFG